MTMIDDVTPSQIKQHENWKAAHRRLSIAPIAKPKVIELVPPTENPAADVMDIIIAAVGNSLGLPVNEIVAGVSTPEIISARKLAMALCVRRPKFAFGRVANHFEVGENVVRDSVGLLDPILMAYAISGKTPLELSMPVISREWALTIERIRKNPPVEKIQSEICRIFKIGKIDLISHRRTAKLVRPRQAAMALCKELTLRSLPEISRLFGGRDHTTVLYAVRRFEPVIAAIKLKIPPDTSVAGWVSALSAEMKITSLTPSSECR